MATISEITDKLKGKAAPEIPAEAVESMPAETEKPAKKKTGRPRAEIDQRQFEKLCHLQCTQVEILTFLGITDKTLTRWCKDTYGKSFSEIFKEKRAGGAISLRRKQWRLADHNAAMAIWLGKQYLDQHDEKDVKVQGDPIGIQIIDDIPKQEKSGEN